jgi:hypothetical protein
MKPAAILLFFIMTIFSACSKKQESKLTAFSPEAFAYDLGDSSEVDASVRVKGFNQKGENDFYKASLSYKVDLVTPSGDTVKSLFNKILDKSQKDKFMDVGLDAQFDLDKSYKKGNYKVLYKIKDLNSDKTTTAAAEFKLGE